MTSRDELVRSLVAFVRGLGLEVKFEAVEGPTQVPGIAISGGALVVDDAKLLYPGDLLHEAAHLAMCPAATRAAEAGFENAGDEIASIAWSWAAALAMGIDPAIVFHEHGYRGGSASIIENFAAGRTFGVPLLAWYGLTREPKHGVPADDGTYPKMIRWLRA